MKLQNHIINLFLKYALINFLKKIWQLLNYVS